MIFDIYGSYVVGANKISPTAKNAMSYLLDNSETTRVGHRTSFVTSSASTRLLAHHHSCLPVKRTGWKDGPELIRLVLLEASSGRHRRKVLCRQNQHQCLIDTNYTLLLKTWQAKGCQSFMTYKRKSFFSRIFSPTNADFE